MEPQIIPQRGYDFHGMFVEYEYELMGYMGNIDIYIYIHLYYGMLMGY